MVRVLLGVTGSVAAVKSAELAALLNGGGDSTELRVVATASARRFMESEAEEEEAGTAGRAGAGAGADGGRCARWRELLRRLDTDEAEWGMWRRKGDPVLHIELRRWADVLVVAPLSANTLAKLAAGICDNLLTSVFRAWEFRAGKPVVLAPAMNTEMWEHPFTERHLDTLRSLGDVRVVEPVVKTLACGDTGRGALAHLPDIVRAVEEAAAARAAAS